MIPGWKPDSVNPQPGVAPGEGFMWSFEPEDHGWAQICIPGWSPDQEAPPKLEAGSGFMWLRQASGARFEVLGLRFKQLKAAK